MICQVRSHLLCRQQLARQEDNAQVFNEIISQNFSAHGHIATLPVIIFAWFRFGSVHYTAMVYVNGQHLVTHAGGHLPFEAEVVTADDDGDR